MIRFFLAFCSFLPFKANHYFGTFLGILLYVLNTDAKNVSKQNLEICFPNLNQADLEKLLKKVLIETGKNLDQKM